MGWNSNVFPLLIITPTGGFTGLFVYSPGPGNGNLIASIAAAAGTDPYGNPFQQGIVSYVAGSPSTYGQLLSANLFFSVAGLTANAGISGGQNLNLDSGTTAALPVPAGLLLQPAAAGGVPQTKMTGELLLIWTAAGAEVLGFRVTTDTVDRLAIDNNGKLSWGPGGNTAADTTLARTGTGQLTIGSGLIVGTILTNGLALTNQTAPGAVAGEIQHYARLGSPAVIQPSGLNNNLSGAQPSDFTSITNTTTVQTVITKAWSIPANDAVVGARYRLTAKGFGTQGTTAENLVFQVFFGVAQTTVQAAFPAAFAAISTGFRWWAEIEAECVTTGGAATWFLYIRVDVGFNGALTIGSNSTGGNTTAITQASNAAITFELQSAWSSGTVACTMTCISSSLERIA